jgi:DNA-binding transcriptional LysR family regulator
MTEEGSIVVDRARRIFNELAAINTDVAALRDHVTGTVRAGMIGTAARWIIPAMMRLLAQDYPGVELIVSEGTSRALEPMLTSGRLDMALVNFSEVPAELDVNPLIEEDLGLVVAKDHPLAHQAQVELESLVGLELLLPAPGTAYRDELELSLRPAGIRLAAKAQMDGLRLIASLTFDGYGPAILPATAIPAYLRKDWSFVPVAGLRRRVIQLAVRRKGLPSAATRAVMALTSLVIADPTIRPGGCHLAG